MIVAAEVWLVYLIGFQIVLTRPRSINSVKWPQSLLLSLARSPLESVYFAKTGIDHDESLQIPYLYYKNNSRQLMC